MDWRRYLSLGRFQIGDLLAHKALYVQDQLVRQGKQLLRVL